MPNIPQQQTIVQYVTNVSQTIYTFAFYAIAPTNIAVYYQASNAQPMPQADLLVLNVNYTVTFNADPTTGGFITLLAPPTTGFYLTIALQLQTTLNTNFANAQNFNGANLDAALDYLLMLIQQVTYYANNRNLSYVVNTYLPNAIPFTQLPPLGVNQVWVGGSAGVTASTIEENPNVSLLRSQLASQTMGADGTGFIGYYDVINNRGNTLMYFLNGLAPILLNPFSDTGSLNALVITPNPTVAAYYQYLRLTVKVANTNTGTATINVNGLGAKNITHTDGSPLIGNEMQAGMIAQLIYDGTNFQLVNPNLVLATNTQALSGTDTQHPVTSAGLASSKSLTTNGYYKLPGGLIIQWGTTAAVPAGGGGGGTVTVTLPIAFPTACFNVQATLNLVGGTGQAATATILSASQIQVANQAASGSPATITWFAIGN